MPKNNNYIHNIYSRSPNNRIYTKYYNYFNSLNDTSTEYGNYDKLNEMNKHTNNSLINEIKTGFNYDNINNSLNNRDKIKYYLRNPFGTIETENNNANTLEVSNKISKRRIFPNKNNFYAKLDLNKLKEDRNKIKVNKLINLKEKPIENGDYSINLSERERYPKSIYFSKKGNNENTISNINNINNKKLKFRLKDLTEKKVFNKSVAYSRKICSKNKSFGKTNNYMGISTNLNMYQISNRINNFCKENNLSFSQTNNKYTINISQANSFVIDINSSNENSVLKFTHEKGDENKTKMFMIGLYSEIAK